MDQDSVRLNFAMQEPENDELVEFLTELAVHLLGQGVGIGQFQTAVQSAYVRAALRNARLRNTRVNQSAVAAITGLTRHQVRSMLRTESDQPSSPQSRAQKVLSAWRTDPAFLDSEGRPRKLSVGRVNSDFSILARRHANDVSQPALLAELTRMGLVMREGATLRLLDPSEVQVKQEPLRVIAAGLAHVVRSAAEMTPDGLRVFSGEVSYPAPKGSRRVVMERRLAQACRALAADIKAAGDALSSSEIERDNPKMATAKILIVTTE